MKSVCRIGAQLVYIAVVIVAILGAAQAVEDKKVVVVEIDYIGHRLRKLINKQFIY